MSHNPVLRWLKTCRRRLNLIYIGSLVFKIFFWYGTLTGLLLWLLRLNRRSDITWQLWLNLLFFLGSAGLVWGWLHRVKLSQTAYWLDEHLGNHELFSAALHCLKPDSREVFSGQILAAAATAVAKRPKIKWPYRNLVFNAIGTVFGFALITALFTWQFNWVAKKAHPAQTRQYKEQYALLNEIIVPDDNPAQCSPRMLARILFAYDIIKANQAERALAEGNWEQLTELISQVKQEIKQKYARAENPEAKKQLEAEQQKLEKVARVLDPKNRNDSLESDNREQGLIANAGQPGGGSEISGRISVNVRTESKPAQRTGDRQADASNQADDDDPYNDYAADTPSQAGEGRGTKDGIWGRVAARAGTERLLISSRRDSPTLEFLLPDKNAKVPLGQAVPAIRRAAEAAVQRDGVPAEYQHFVSNYFTGLTQQTNRIKVKEEPK